MTKPLISIITVNKNDAGGLKKTIDSVLGQTFTSFELIVIDGASTDGSLEVIKACSEKLGYWISEPDGGIYDAQNKGIVKANGEYLLFLNSGDLLVNHMVLEVVAPKMKSRCSFYYGDIVIENNGHLRNEKAPESVDLDFMLNHTFWHPCTFIQQKLFREFGGYRTNFKIAGDYEFFIRCLLKPDISAMYLNETIAVFEGGGVSNQPGNKELIDAERELAWKTNLSEVVYEALKAQNKFHRSKYSDLVTFIERIRGRK